MSGTRQEKPKKPSYRQFYGVNAAAYLTMADIQSLIAQKEFDTINRGYIQKAYLHYLRFVRTISETDIGED